MTPKRESQQGSVRGRGGRVHAANYETPRNQTEATGKRLQAELERLETQQGLFRPQGAPKAAQSIVRQ